MHFFPFRDLGFAQWVVIIEKVQGFFFFFFWFKFYIFGFWAAENHGKGKENLDFFE